MSFFAIEKIQWNKIYQCDITLGNLQILMMCSSHEKVTFWSKQFGWYQLSNSSQSQKTAYYSIKEQDMTQIFCTNVISLNPF